MSCGSALIYLNVSSVLSMRFVVGEDYEEPQNATIVLSFGISLHARFWRRVTILDDSLYENEEFFTLTLTADDPSVVVFNESEAVVIIEDNDTGTIGVWACGSRSNSKEKVACMGI